jgi:hypothetical protein
MVGVLGWLSAAVPTIQPIQVTISMFVMPGLVSGIHVFLAAKTWMAGTKPGHDGREVGLVHRPQYASHDP